MALILLKRQIVFDACSNSHTRDLVNNLPNFVSYGMAWPTPEKTSVYCISSAKKRGNVRVTTSEGYKVKRSVESTTRLNSSTDELIICWCRCKNTKKEDTLCFKPSIDF